MPVLTTVWPTATLPLLGLSAWQVPSLVNYINHIDELLLHRQLWNLDDGVPLTPRVAFASTFENIITDTFRDDVIVTLPNPATD